MVSGTDSNEAIENMFQPARSLYHNYERPNWSRGGTLSKRIPIRHYIPKHRFYYSNQELFGEKKVEDYEPDTRKQTHAFVTSQLDQEATRRAFSAPHKPRSRASRESLPEAEGGRAPSSRLSRPKTAAPALTQAQIKPPLVDWLSTPIPGIRTIQSYDQYRRTALDMKNTNIYLTTSGLIPKYRGYVPGDKFRYGSTFGNITYNAKEVGVKHSTTWGGAVSLCF